MKLKAELTFPGKLKNQPLICSLCKKFNLVVSVLEASFSTDIGWALLGFKGQEKEINKALDYLRKQGVEIEDMVKES